MILVKFREFSDCIFELIQESCLHILDVMGFFGFCQNQGFREDAPHAQHSIGLSVQDFDGRSGVNLIRAGGGRHLLTEAQEAKPLVSADNLVLRLNSQEATELHRVRSLRQGQRKHLRCRVFIYELLLLLLWLTQDLKPSEVSRITQNILGVANTQHLRSPHLPVFPECAEDCTAITSIQMAECSIGNEAHYGGNICMIGTMKETSQRHILRVCVVVIAP